MAFTRDFIFWCSDDQSGRLFRVNRANGNVETLFGRSQFVWFAVARGEQVYVGTITSAAEGGQRPALLASSDQGNTWQKLLVGDVSTGPYSHAFYAESRELSAGGWLYCTRGHSPKRQSYRVRATP